MKIDISCHGAPCEYDTNSYDNGNVRCRNCGESALVGSCDQPHACEPCRYALDDGGYLSDTDQPRRMHCRHCARLAWIY